MALHLQTHAALGARTQNLSPAHCHSTRCAQARAQAFLPAHHTARRCVVVVRAAGAGSALSPVSTVVSKVCRRSNGSDSALTRGRGRWGEG